MAEGSDEAAERRDGRRTDTRQRIEAAALELFLAQGFSRTSLQDIADRVGLTKAALYYHFPSKDALIRELIQPVVDEVDGFLERAEQQGMSAREVVEGFYDLNRRNRTVLLAITRDPTALTSLDAENWVPRLAAAAQRLLAGDDPDPEQRVRAVFVVGGLSRSAALLPDVDPDELRRASVDVAMELLGGR